MNETNLTMNETITGAGDFGVQIAQQGGQVLNKGIMETLTRAINGILETLKIGANIDSNGLGLIFMLATVLLLWFKARVVFDAIKVYIGAILVLLAIYIIARAFHMI